MPTVTHAPTATTEYNVCSCCCLKMGCSDGMGGRAWPPRLSFIASIGGSCPQAITATQSGTMSVFGSEVGDPPDGDYHPEGCADILADGCELRWPQLCVCFYAWQLADADIPACGPYIRRVTLQCIPRPTLDPPYAPPTNCPHLKYNGQCLWYVQVEVVRADYFPQAIPVICPHGEVCHAEQDCDTCGWVTVVGSGGPPICCETCPPCFGCPTDITRLCDLDQICCGLTGCSACICEGGTPCAGECSPCNFCWEQVAPFGFFDSSCVGDERCTSAAYGSRRYHFYMTACDTDDDLLGCNATSCGPDEKNLGDFFLHFGCDDNDYIEFACP